VEHQDGSHPLKFNPPTHRHDTDLEAIIATASQDLAEIYMTFINTYIQPLAHKEHSKHFTVSLQGSLRYNPTPLFNTLAESTTETS
jgi:hypothetical protein